MKEYSKEPSWQRCQLGCLGVLARRMFIAILQWGRRVMSSSWKRRIKWLMGVDSTSNQVQIPLPSDSVEHALRIWTGAPRFCQPVGQMLCSVREAPGVSVVVLTRDKLPLTRLCVESLYRKTEYPYFELIVADNASEDGTRAYLEGLQSFLPNFHVIFNKGNEGFARANNQGILRSFSDYVVLLNNDTIVTRGWLSRLISYLDRDPSVGMVGPVTNSAGNEQMILATYTSLEELEAFASERMRAHAGQSLEVKMLGMFCVAMRRGLVDQVGLLDERFGLGNFEDDDYSRRTKLCGYKMICAEDVFIHHFGKGTMGDLGDTGYFELFEHNRRQFEDKWDVKWHPHRMRV